MGEADKIPSENNVHKFRPKFLILQQYNEMLQIVPNRQKKSPKYDYAHHFSHIR